jgi:hypothetical protein
MNHHPAMFAIPRNWTPKHALNVFEWLHGIAYALWDAYDDELLDAIESRSGIDDRQLELPF